MSTYQELKGLKVKYLYADTSGDRAKEGELFYNSSSGNLKAFVATQSWISTPSMGTGRNMLRWTSTSPNSANWWIWGWFSGTSGTGTHTGWSAAQNH